MTSTVADAYSVAGPGWQVGPGAIYDRLAEISLETSGVDCRDALVLDLGAGTGAATRAAERRGARVIAVDAALGMLRHARDGRPPAAVGDALALPFRDGTFDVVFAAFSLNHLPNPADGLREAARVLRARGSVLATAYAEDDSHPVKQAVEDAARALGWSQAGWYGEIREAAVPKLATEQRAGAAAQAAGLVDVHAWRLAVPFPDLRPEHLVAWRLGLAQLAGFVAALSDGERERLVDDALARLGQRPPPLVRSMIVLTARTV